MHDSELLKIVIDRVNKDANRVQLHLDYIEDYTTMKSSAKTIVFSGCVKAVFDMNFNVATPDSLKGGFEIEPSPLLEAAKARMLKSGLEIARTVKHFRIETNSTGSIIDILAEQLDLVESALGN